MANKFQKGLGLAGTGAMAGTAIAPGIGTAIGAGAGFLAGQLFGDDPQPEAPLFSDINLQTENPELYAQLMQYDAAIKQAQDAYRARSGGILPQEQRYLDQSLNQQREQQAGLGILGSGTANNQQAQMQMQLRDAIAQRAFQEQQAMQQNIQGMMGNRFNMSRQALNDVMQQRMGGYQGEMADQQAGNQFWSGLASGGLQGAVGLYNADKMGGIYDRLYPQASQPMEASYMPSMPAAQLAYNGPMFGVPRPGAYR